MVFRTPSGETLAPHVVSLPTIEQGLYVMCAPARHFTTAVGYGIGFNTCKTRVTSAGQVQWFCEKTLKIDNLPVDLLFTPTIYCLTITAVRNTTIKQVKIPFAEMILGFNTKKINDYGIDHMIEAGEQFQIVSRLPWSHHLNNRDTEYWQNEVAFSGFYVPHPEDFDPESFKLSLMYESTARLTVRSHRPDLIRNRSISKAMETNSADAWFSGWTRCDSPFEVSDFLRLSKERVPFPIETPAWPWIGRISIGLAMRATYDSRTPDRPFVRPLLKDELAWYGDKKHLFEARYKHCYEVASDPDNRDFMWKLFLRRKEIFSSISNFKQGMVPYQVDSYFFATRRIEGRTFTFKFIERDHEFAPVHWELQNYIDNMAAKKRRVCPILTRAIEEGRPLILASHKSQKEDTETGELLIPLKEQAALRDFGVVPTLFDVGTTRIVFKGKEPPAEGFLASTRPGAKLRSPKSKKLDSRSPPYWALDGNRRPEDVVHSNVGEPQQLRFRRFRLDGWDV